MSRFVFLGFSVFLVVIDQLSKWVVTEYMIRVLIDKPETKSLGLLEWYTNTPAPLPFAEYEILPFFNIVMVWNKGISFGLFNQTTDYGPVLLIAISFFITFFFLIWMFRTRDPALLLGLSMIVGGAIGNVIDRFRFGAVIDFLDFHVGGWHYPAFNVADSCIVLGVGFLMIYTIFFEKTLHKQEGSV